MPPAQGAGCRTPAARSRARREAAQERRTAPPGPAAPSRRSKATHGQARLWPRTRAGRDAAGDPRPTSAPAASPEQGKQRRRRALSPSRSRVAPGTQSRRAAVNESVTRTRAERRASTQNIGSSRAAAAQVGARVEQPPAPTIKAPGRAPPRRSPPRRRSTARGATPGSSRGRASPIRASVLIAACSALPAASFFEAAVDGDLDRPPRTCRSAAAASATEQALELDQDDRQAHAGRAACRASLSRSRRDSAGEASAASSSLARSFSSSSVRPLPARRRGAMRAQQVDQLVARDRVEPGRQSPASLPVGVAAVVEERARFPARDPPLRWGRRRDGAGSRRADARRFASRTRRIGRAVAGQAREQERSPQTFLRRSSNSVLVLFGRGQRAVTRRPRKLFRS